MKKLAVVMMMSVLGVEMAEAGIVPESAVYVQASEAVQTPQLNLPEEYAVRYEITTQSNGKTTTHEYGTMIEDGLYYFDLENEKMTFTEQENGTYVLSDYIFEDRSGDIIENIVTEGEDETEKGVMTKENLTISESEVPKYGAEVSWYFDCYKTYPYLESEGSEEIDGVLCDKYSSVKEENGSVKKAIFWVEPKTGLCLQYEMIPQNYGESVVAKCVSFEAENMELSDMQ